MDTSETEGRNLRLFAKPDFDEPSTGSRSEEPTLAEKLLGILDQIHAMDKTMDEGRAAKIANIKKAIAEGTYHVSAAEVARKIIDQMNEP
jgi:flagellar biosynthesis anti-sigma factor FlgM